MPVDCKCLECGKEFKVKPYAIKRGRGKFCGKECQYKWMSKNNCGDKNPNYNNRWSDERKKEFSESRMGDKNPFYKGVVSEEHKLKLKLIHTKLTNANKKLEIPEVKLDSSILDKKKYMGEYYVKNMEKLKSRQLLNYANNKYEVLYWYSDGLMKCGICGEDHIEFLCLDHIEDGGADHRREIGAGGGRIHQYLLRNLFPEGYQVLCNNCNYLKEYNRVQNKDKSQSIHAIRVRTQRLKLRLQTLYRYSNGLMKCECCGEEDDRLLTIDHINGGGKQHFKDNNIKNLCEYLHYKHYPEDGYRVLCWNCNKSHGQYGYCPHGTVVEDKIKEE